MARLTGTFEVLVELDVPYKVATRMCKRDVCDSLELAVRTESAAPVVLDGDVHGSRFAWNLRPKSDELPVEKLDLDVFADNQFPRLLESSRCN
jgi:hypothetical protein